MDHPASSSTSPSLAPSPFADVVIVGAGLGGLATATRLAAAGLRVIVCERAAEVGGRGRTQVREGFSLNLGAHALYRNGPAMAMLRELGVEPRGRLPTLRGAILRDGREHTLPATPLSMLSTSALDLRAKFELVRVFARLRKLDTEALREIDCRTWLADAITSDRLREFFAASIRLACYTGELGQLSAEAGLGQLRRALPGVLYLDGGWAQLGEGLTARARAAGVELRLGARVESVARADVARWAVEVDGGTIACEHVVVAAGPAQADALLGPALGEPGFRAATSPCTVAVLDLGLRGTWPGPGFVIDLDEPIYLSVHSNDAAVAPRDHTLVSLAWYRDRDESRTPAQLRERLEQLVRRWMPDFEASLVVEQFLPKITVANDLPRSDRGGLSGRAPTELGDGLHLVGDWVGDVGMLLDASMASADRVSAAILDAPRLASGEQPRAAEHARP